MEIRGLTKYKHPIWNFQLDDLREFELLQPVHPLYVIKRFKKTRDTTSLNLIQFFSGLSQLHAQHGIWHILSSEVNWNPHTGFLLGVKEDTLMYAIKNYV